MYEKYSYLEAYMRHTDRRVTEDPHDAIGGRWEELGDLQYQYLCDQGYDFIQNSLLDYGCGTGRLASRILRQKDGWTAHYTGVDLSKKAIDYCMTHYPHYMFMWGKEIDTNPSMTFDYIIAHSVLTHLPPEHIQNFFDYIPRMMNRGTKLFFTYWPGDEVRQRGVSNFHYPFAALVMLATPHLRLEEDPSYKHPRGQRMVKAWRT